MDLIDRQAAMIAVTAGSISTATVFGRTEEGMIAAKEIIRAIKSIPSAQPERLTDDDFETIRIHLNAYKEKLCNQQRWEEADEYQRIIDRFMAFASAQPEQKMTNAEAIETLRAHYPDACYEQLREAVDAAIEAMKAQDAAGDTISRKAAIRWVKTECNPYGKPTIDFESGIKVIEHLENMPSAQPDIIRCKDCKHSIDFYDDGECYCRSPNRGLDWIGDWNFYCKSAERREE